jgi:toxin YoeB
MDKDWDDAALEDYFDWQSVNPRIAGKINDLLADIEKQPFAGLGKPEKLKHNLRGWWSRHITGEHRLVYRISGDLLVILSCREHYTNLDQKRIKAKS